MQRIMNKYKRHFFKYYLITNINKPVNLGGILVNTSLEILNFTYCKLNFKLM